MGRCREIRGRRRARSSSALREERGLTRGACGARDSCRDWAASMFLESEVELRRVAGAGQRGAEAAEWAHSQGSPLVAARARGWGFLRCRAPE